MPASDPTSAAWQALAREATSAAEHIAFGATVLGRASYARSAYYAQAFFSLSIGLERSGKIAVVVDHAIDHGGQYPPSQTLQALGHDLRKILTLTDEIGKTRGCKRTLPSSAIHEGIIDTLSDFASNVTRYYNLEFVTGSSRTAGREGPISAWFHAVTEPILAAHYKRRYRQKHERNARIVESLIGEFSLVHHHAESGEEIDSVFAGSARTALTDFSKPWERMYVLQIARFVGAVLSGLSHEANNKPLPEIPYFPEIFAIFNNEDSYFRRRATWSIY